MSTTDHGHIPYGATKPRVVDERHALVQRVVWSRSFEKSARMRDFLVYVCERTLDKPEADIHEQDIGCAVFGRPPDYDTNVDNIVRVNASQLRKKLEAHFACEGASEPLIFEIPKGKYVPVFRTRSGAAGDRRPEASVACEAAVGPSFSNNLTLRRAVFCLAALSLLLMVVCAWLAVAWRSARSEAKGELDNNPTLNALWSQLLIENKRTDIVVTDSSLGLIQDLLERPIPLSEYLHPDLWARADSLASKPDAQAAARLAAHRRYTSLANVNITRRILAMAGTNQGDVALCFARDFNIRQMKSDNVILLGSRRANPWVELVENKMNFRFGFDDSSRQSYFENKQPKRGEQATYRNDSVVSYCDIAFLPNLSGTGNILVISGTEMEGTELGGEFLTAERWISGLPRFVPMDRNGRFPYFEVLLKTSKIGGAAPGFEVIASRLPQL